MTKVHAGLLNMDKSTFGLSQKGVCARATRHSVNHPVQTSDFIKSGLGEEMHLFIYFERIKDSFYMEERWGLESSSIFF